jgi:gamma-glutamyltranspeptidase/glutathione hydrolase
MTWPIYAETRAYLGQNGPNAREGALLKAPGVARLIREMADAEDAALAAGKSRSDALKAARDEFYMGNFAKTIDQFSRDTGGYTRWVDYATYSGYWVEQEDMPHTTFMGLDFYADTPNSQGPALIQVLNMLELAKERTGKSLYEMGYYTADYINYITQAIDLAFSDRWHYYGDPKFVDTPKQLWTKEYARERVKLIDINRHFQRLPPPGDPRNMQGTLAGWKEWTLPPKVAGAPDQQLDLAMVADETRTDTTRGDMMDADGNIFAFTPSDPGPLVPGYQVRISGRNRQFVYDPAMPSFIAPGKRPQTTPHVFIVVKNGEGYMQAQTSGGDDAVQASVQALLNVLLWNMNPQVAIEQPKFGTNNYISWFTPHIEGAYGPGEVTVARGVPALMNTVLGVTAYPPKTLTDELTRRGAKTGVDNYPGPGYGLTMLLRDPVSRVVLGGSAAWTDESQVSWGR